MKCIICNAECELFLTKDYANTQYKDIMKEIGPMEYSKCPECGFSACVTLQNLDATSWENLNHEFHHLIESPEFNMDGQPGQPPYIQQATMLKILSTWGIIDSDDMIDYAAGYGTLSKILKKYFGMKMRIYDPYVQSDDADAYIPREQLGKYKTVFNSAIFEHLTTRADFDEINNCVSDDGCMIIHTVVCENIPKNPNWFYLDPPVHCAFHTNKSMNLLMAQWGYKASIYCPKAKCWVLLKNSPAEIEKNIQLINKELQYEYLIYKSGFVDYWKGF